VIALIAVGIEGEAQAIETKIYPGSFCHQVGDSDDTSSNGPYLRNLSATSILVSCPILRDNVSSTSGWSQIEVWVGDKSDVGAIECVAYAREPDGTVHYLDAAATGAETMTPASLWEKLSIPGGGPQTAVPNGTYGLVCTLPGGSFPNVSGIGGYRMVEP
jgi:hypothetical protein